MNKREERIADLVDLLAMYEEIPDLPVPDVSSMGYCVLAGDDAAGRAEIRRVAAILSAAGKRCAITENGHDVGLRCGPYYAFYVLRESMARHRAARSYDDNVSPSLGEAA